MRYRTDYKGQLWILLLWFIVIVSSCSSSETLMVKQIDSLLYDAESFVAKGDYSGAVSLYERARSQYPHEQRLSYNYALVLAQAGDFQKSLSVLTELNEQTDFSHVMFLKALAGVAASSGEIELAHTYWEKIIEKDPLDANSRKLLMKSLVSLGKYEEAYQLAYAAYELHLFDAELFRMLEELTYETERGNGNSWKIIASAYESKTSLDFSRQH